VSTIARLSLAQYDHMIAAGVFDQREHLRLEFIEGEIREMSPIGPQHSEIVERLTAWSYKSLSHKKGRARGQDAVTLPEQESAPQPDIMWLVPGDYVYHRPTAADVLLVIEVAESSLAYDTGEKADLYAAAGIADYWVVNLIDRCIEVRREPVGGRYRSLKTHLGEDEVRPLAFPEVALKPGSLWES
jgi:Uma2 family endonuclease